MNMIEKLKKWLGCVPKSDDRLVSYSEANFLEWNREREKHLQMIAHLEMRVSELSAERDMWRRESMRGVTR